MRAMLLVDYNLRLRESLCLRLFVWSDSIGARITRLSLQSCRILNLTSLLCL